MSQAFDVLVVGSGPGGYVAAIRASQLGLKTAIVEAEDLGGVCLNWGCIPTKALLRSAEIGRSIKHANQFGWSAGEATFDLSKVVEYSRNVSSKLSGGVAYLMKKNKVSVIEGWASLLGKGKIKVSSEGKETTYSSKHIILATGAKARILEGLEPDGKLIVTAKDAMTPKSLPTSMLVVGSGAIGIEFASFYNELGTKVTVLEVQDRILPAEDAEISKLAAQSFQKQGMELLLGAKFSDVKKLPNEVEITLTKTDGSRETRKFDRVISAVGIVGNVDNIGLENTAVKTDRSHIVTDEWMATGETGLYAIGDVTGAPWLAHKASHEAFTCVERIAGLESAHPIDTNLVPGCTYSHPQIASIGLTENQAKQTGHKFAVGRFPFSGNGKAIALGEPEGLIKTIVDSNSGEILGVHMIGAEVTELINSISIAMTLECTEEYLLRTIFPHPTLSEMIHESTLDALGRAVHI